MEWLSWLALALLAAVVGARAMMPEEFLHHAAPVSPGARAVPVPAGPAAGVVLDLLACVPALLVLLRRAFDRHFTLKQTLSTAAFALLGAWAIFSSIWAADKFAVVVTASHLVAAVAVLWAAAQVVRCWLGLRLAAGLCVGILLVLVGHGVQYVVWERPAMRADWDAHREENLRTNNLEPGSFAAKQLEIKVLGGEVMGFSTSANTYAAMIVLTLTVTLGLAIDRFSAARHSAPTRVIIAGLLLPVLIPSLWMLRVAASKTALATAVLGVTAVFVLGLWHASLARHARRIYWAVVGLLVFATTAVVGHGWWHGTLFQRSLTFRWHYWVGAARIFRQHPLIGVGWNNFGTHYLAARLPLAPEEIDDPHNFVVRCFVELGIIGGFLLLAWMLRMWWELTQQPAMSLLAADRPNTPLRGMSPDDKCDDVSSADDQTTADSPWRGNAGMLAVVVAALACVGINVLASVDFDFGWAYATTELFRRALYLLGLLAGVGVVALRLRRQADAKAAEIELDDRPMPWTLSAIMVAVAMFMLHNLLDFSMSEPGPLLLMALLAGAALGMRLPERAAQPSGRSVAGAALVGGGVIWLVALAAFARPLLGATDADQVSADEMRAGRINRAAESLEAAFHEMPLNGDYAFRAANTWAQAGDAARAAAMYDAAVAAQPLAPAHYVVRAEFEMSLAVPNLLRARDDFEHALRIDPCSVPLRERFAEALAKRLGSATDAIGQFELALWYDNQLPPDEPKRLSPADRVQVRRRIESLRTTGHLPKDPAAVSPVEKPVEQPATQPLPTSGPAPGL